MKGGANRGKGANLAWLKEHVGFAGDECLKWPFSKNWNGYGNIVINGRSGKAHRVMCELAHGPAPTGHVASHSCNNGHLGCVNPRHLQWKTPRDNLLDRRSAGTLTKKRWTRRGTLTTEQIAQIMALKGVKNQREIAAMFGLSYQHVSFVHRGKLKRSA